MAHQDDDTISNPSTNTDFASVLDIYMTRRQLIKGGLGLAAVSVFGTSLAGCKMSMNFSPIGTSTEDAVRVPPGYVATVLYAWGDPVSDGPVFMQNAGNSAADQALQAGMHHDGMHFFPLPFGSRNSSRGLLAINHEYTDDGLLHSDGMQAWTAEKVQKSKAAHGVSIIEVELSKGRWSVVRPSRYGRRITADTPIGLSGPAAGGAFMKTAADPDGLIARGTLNNCANGYTPWGTYLTCEENWNGYFVNRSGDIPAEQARYGITATGFNYRWHEFDERFDAAVHPNEPNRFGWVVEIDPFNPASRPVKRTAMGRFKHEGATLSVSLSNRAVFYMGDDERFEYIYKFVSRDPYSRAPKADNSRILDNGTLYVARFNADGTGVWLPLVHGEHGLTAENGFASQAEILVKTRQAADRVGATKMDRPEWIAVHPVSREVYVTLTNNNRRGATGQAGADAANPRANNIFGHILRWREENGDPAATRFAWDIFILAGDPANSDPNKRGNINGDIFGSPDGLWFDDFGTLWIQTDVSTSVLNKGDYIPMGNNQMLAADTTSGKVMRFLTGPNGCEITGVTMTPDGRSMFINIQHPGETASERSDPANPKAVSAWPDGPSGGRPRSATVVIRKIDGGFIGS